jgi:restriction endonuclease Mrr
MLRTLIIFGFFCFWTLIMLSALAQGNPGGLVALVPIALMLYVTKKGLEEEEQFRKQQEEARLKAEEQARQERATREWEQTPAGRAHLEQQARREAEEAERRREHAARANWRNFHESKTMLEISEMSGLDFERFLARLLTKMGYQNLEITPINDQGGDLVGTSPQGLRTVVQAKRWKKSLGISVVQELLGAMLHYGCHQGLIITNSTFTSAARNLAAKDSRITLCDGRWLEEQARKYLPPVIPEFNWVDYNQYVKQGILPRIATISGK